MSTSRETGSRRLGPDDLRRAVESGVISAEQRDALWQLLDAEVAPDLRPRFDLAHLLWYTGALIVIGAMGLFSSLAFSEWGGGALAITAIVYAALFVALAILLWGRGLNIPGGLCLVVAVTMAPLLVFGLQNAFGWWSHGDPGGYQNFYGWIKASWLPMEIATIVAGLVAFRFCRFPFLIAPIAVALWFLSMDLVPWIFGENWNSWEQRAVVSVYLGVAMLAVAWWADVRAGGDDAFWLHVFGLIIFWGGLTSMATDSDRELFLAIYCLVNIGLLVLAIFLQRRAYVVFGAFGIALYLEHLAGEVFRDSLLYPFALSLIGLLILGAGLFYHRKQASLDEGLRRHLPPGLQHLRPHHAR